jgi:hypothetical protein
VAADVGRVDAVAVDEGVGDGVPVAGMIAAAVDEEERRLALVAPDGVVQLQPLRGVEAGLGLDDGLLLRLPTD